MTPLGKTELCLGGGGTEPDLSTDNPDTGSKPPLPQRSLTVHAARDTRVVEDPVQLCASGTS
jgi:hypothetical protein